MRGRARSFRRHVGVRDHQRQPDAKCRALPLAGAFRSHRAAVQLHQVTNDGEAETQAGVFARRPGVALTEAFEHERQELRLDAGPRVADHDLDVRIDVLEDDLDPSAFRRELDGVRHEIPHDLLQAIRIAGDGGGPRIENRVHAQLFRIRGRRDGLERALDYCRHVDRLNVEPNLSRDDSRDVEDVSDDLREHGGVALDGVERARLLARVEHPRSDEP